MCLQGRTRKALVGRCKLEQRPLVSCTQMDNYTEGLVCTTQSLPSLNQCPMLVMPALPALPCAPPASTTLPTGHPLQVLVEARAADGSTHSVLLQNAETVKLVGLPQGLAASSSSDASGSGTAAGTGTGVAAGSKAWRTISVAAMQPGDVVMLHRPATAARHMGIAIQEHIVEQ